MRRRGRPGLMGTVARTAVVAGTATVVAKGVGNKMDSKEEAKQQQEQAAQQPPPPADPAPAAAAPADDDELVDELQKLAALKESGALSDEEFATAKAKLLAG